MKSPFIPSLRVESIAIADLKSPKRNARTHSHKQIKQIAQSYELFGICNPILISDDNTIIVGSGRVAAAKLLEMTHLPALRLSHLKENEIRAFAIAENRLSELAGWDPEILAVDFQNFIEVGVPIEILGFSMTEIDGFLLGKNAGKKPESDCAIMPDPNATSASMPGDLWLMGNHRLHYGSALNPDCYMQLLQGEQPDLSFTDPPYNVPVNGHIGGRGSIQHSNFIMASGEMSAAEFTNFLKTTCMNIAQHSKDGSVHFLCIDWRHLGEAIAAGTSAYDDFLNLCVWNKANAGMGSLYRSKHEHVLVFKRGSAPHVNNVELGKHGRSRTNVWDYPGANGFRRGRQEALEMHPTVKPTALVADTILDVSRRNDIILDPFGGSGTTLIAAERTGRRARLIEIDPAYCDTSIRRWQKETGKQAVHSQTGKTFDETCAERTAVIQAVRQRAVPPLPQESEASTDRR